LNGRGQLWRAALADVVASPTAPVAPTAVFADRTWSLASETWGTGFGIARNGSLWYWSDQQLEDHLRGASSADATLRTPRQLMLGTRFVDACIQGARLHAVDDRGHLWRSRDLQPHRVGGDPLQGDRTGMEELSLDGNARRVYCRENASHVLVLDDRGRLFGYGLNLFGELGVGEPDLDADRAALFATQLRLVSGRHWIALAIGPQVSMGITSDGALWGWGRNLDHELGLGDSASRHEPALIDQSRPWVAVTATYGTGVAMSADGELHAWGSNGTGALGDGGIAMSHDRPAAVLTSAHFGTAHGP
jgi:alpha-tubulin suppressor-like RCC1 family protein